MEDSPLGHLSLSSKSRPICVSSTMSWSTRPIYCHWMLLTLYWLPLAPTFLNNPIKAFFIAMPSLSTIPLMVSLLFTHVALPQGNWVISWMILLTPHTLRIGASPLPLCIKPSYHTNFTMCLSSYRSTLSDLRRPTHHTSWSLVSSSLFELTILYSFSFSSERGFSWCKSRLLSLSKPRLSWIHHLLKW